jgi:hypothetical protein
MAASAGPVAVDLPAAALDLDSERTPFQDAPMPASAAAGPETGHGPWARLVGVGPTAAFGIFDLQERQVVFGKFSKKGQEAHIRIDDPRIRYASARGLRRRPT